MTQFLVASGLERDTVLLDGEEARHLSCVHRVQPGERVRLFDGAGRVADGVVIRATRSAVELSVHNRREYSRIFPEIVVRPALIKQDRFELLLEKCTELGADRFAPVVTARSSMSAGTFRTRVERFRRILLETAKQCNRTHLAVLGDPVALADTLQSCGSGVVRVAAVLVPGAGSVIPVLHDAGASGSPGSSIELFVGPEGDYTDEETAMLRAAGVRCVTLGSAILRAETAAMFLTGLAALHRS
jgi:16S rRNA (uracil1498-N3)-methyltransferase